jgi:hypothetical protein
VAVIAVQATLTKTNVLVVLFTVVHTSLERAIVMLLSSTALTGWTGA